MLRLRDPQDSLWDQLLPPQARSLSAELTAVGEYLANDRFFEPSRQRFRTLIGRPTVPVETYLRLMYLKHRYRLGYETLVWEVTDSLHWRRFCHLTLDAPVPHPTTLSKLRRKYGPDVVHELNRLLIQHASEQKLLRSCKLRADTTVVPGTHRLSDRYRPAGRQCAGGDADRPPAPSRRGGRLNDLSLPRVEHQAIARCRRA